MKLLMMASIWFIASTHPISMILILIFSTLLMNFCIYTQLKNTWFPLMVTLLILGGMLTIFLYITSLTPNKKFYMSKLPILLSMTLFLIKTKTNLYMSFHQNQISSMFSNSLESLIIIMMIYLLMTLVAIMMMIKASMAPMKSSS
uniref:NADH dehydrogenase subunit 6 n=1 Tax=Ornithodoros compactus TaxID=1580120 RepID=UPI000738ED8A|nr:NADH dehydrogenase subunit 6 [Ornithodoros compactus]AIZ58567.1 NADH dehydrogenase subunit 6 [Ornithodoros compactus]QLD97216.1 NADH dehydrogenase subunit 6 [Ornithodoros compactus]QLD97229.1 NADH dehydrogenase subunit 6 [Ornithodoros compactus]UYB78272.1 NADH dehydrogenase subunit 6 [Ornithodoros compactus]